MRDYTISGMLAMNPEVVYLLRKARRGLPLRHPAMETISLLRSEGFIAEKRGLFRTRLRLTRKGKALLRQARLSPDRVIRGIADGLCDHLNYGLFMNLLSVDGLASYIDSQRLLYRLIVLHLGWQR